MIVFTAEGISLLSSLSLRDFDIWHVPSLDISFAYLRRCTKVTKETRISDIGMFIWRPISIHGEVSLKIEMISAHCMLDTDYDMTYISSGNKWQLFDSIVDLKCLSMV